MSSTDRTYTRTALREFAASARRYWSNEEERGRYNAVYPNGDGKRDIPDFSLQMVEWALEYYRLSGDVDLLEELYPQLRDTAGYVLRHLQQSGPTAGLVTDLGGGSGPYLHGIVDWPAPGRFGYDMDTAARTTVNAQAYGVLDGVAQLAKLLERPAGEAVAYRRAADQLAVAMNARLRVDGRFIDGLYADGTPSTHASSHATAFPLSLGVTEPDFWTSDAGYLTSRGMRQGPMTVHRLFRALLRAGQVQSVVCTLYTASDAAAANIAAAAERGATVLISYFSGIVDQHDAVRLGGYPGAFRELLGINTEEFHPLPEHGTVELDNGWTGRIWSENVRLAGAEAIASFTEYPLAGVPALTRRAVGAGAAWYLATFPERAALAELVDSLLAESGVCAPATAAPGVELTRRLGADGSSFLFAINHTGSDAKVTASGREVITGKQFSGVVPALSVAVVAEGVQAD